MGTQGAAPPESEGNPTEGGCFASTLRIKYHINFKILLCNVNVGGFSRSVFKWMVRVRFQESNSYSCLVHPLSRCLTGRGDFPEKRSAYIIDYNNKKKLENNAIKKKRIKFDIKIHLKIIYNPELNY